MFTPTMNDCIEDQDAFWRKRNSQIDECRNEQRFTSNHDRSLVNQPQSHNHLYRRHPKAHLDEPIEEMPVILNTSEPGKRSYRSNNSAFSDKRNGLPMHDTPNQIMSKEKIQQLKHT